jgi:hypothetical protein
MAEIEGPSPAESVIRKQTYILNNRAMLMSRVLAVSQSLGFSFRL